MKKWTIILTALLLSMSLCACAETVYVTVSAGGQLQLTDAPVEATDADGDGVISVCDALYAAHEAYFEGGSKAGFAAEGTDYGISLNKLWGVDNGGSFGYRLNDLAAMSLLDAIAEGDRVYAYDYTDLVNWSDKYSFFDRYQAEAVVGEEITLTLQYVDYDENWAEITLPVAGAAVTVNGEKTDIVTDENGVFTYSASATGTVIISAGSDALVLTPPVCVITVK